jgi:6-hydroxy-3-succinoylpyridine 3-monooxygenase
MDNALRTRVYIDGYNLYYGCLKNSPDKWLDVRAARKWLNQPCAHLGGRIPIAMCESAEEASELQHYSTPKTLVFETTCRSCGAPPLTSL